MVEWGEAIPVIFWSICLSQNVQWLHYLQSIWPYVTLEQLFCSMHFFILNYIGVYRN